MRDGLCWLLVCGKIPAGVAGMRLRRAAFAAVEKDSMEKRAPFANNFYAHGCARCLPSTVIFHEHALRETFLGRFLHQNDIAHVFCYTKSKEHRLRLETLKALAIQRGVELRQHLI